MLVRARVNCNQKLLVTFQTHPVCACIEECRSIGLLIVVYIAVAYECDCTSLSRAGNYFLRTFRVQLSDRRPDVLMSVRDFPLPITLKR